MPIFVEAERPDGTIEQREMYPGAKCSICGSEHVCAMWSGNEEIFVCGECATNILPRIIADAISAGNISYEVFLMEANRAKVAFWQAAHCAAMIDHPKR